MPQDHVGALSGVTYTIPSLDDDADIEVAFGDFADTLPASGNLPFVFITEDTQGVKNHMYLSTTDDPVTVTAPDPASDGDRIIACQLAGGAVTISTGTVDVGGGTLVTDGLMKCVNGMFADGKWWFFSFGGDATDQGPGGAGTVAVPQFSHTGTGTFQITNFADTVTYSGTASAGTVTISDTGLVSVSDPNATVTIVATLTADNTKTATGVFERKAWTYTTVITGSYQCGTHAINPCGCGGDCAAGAAPGQTECHNCCGTYPAYCNTTEQRKNPCPEGYIEEYGEWWRVVTA